MASPIGYRSETSDPVDRFVRPARLNELDPITQSRLIDLASVNTNGDQFAVGDVDNQIAPILVFLPGRWFEVLANHQTAASSRHPHPSFSHPPTGSRRNPVEEHTFS